MYTNVFKITALEYQGKFKLSQKQGREDRSNVIAKLREFPDPNSAELAGLMAKIEISEK